ncbi:hypothetical protein ACFSTC_09360 [Nonomuraea ferruginea]
MLVGGATGSAMNVVPVIGVYAALCARLGLPFGFPGGRSYVWEAVDARIVASALSWARSSPAARGETFNITNGDVFEWRDLWPAIAAELGMEPSGRHTPGARGLPAPARARVEGDRAGARAAPDAPA